MTSKIYLHNEIYPPTSHATEQYNSRLLLQLRISQLVTDDALQLTYLLSASMDNISCFFEAFAVISSPENEIK